MLREQRARIAAVVTALLAVAAGAALAQMRSPSAAAVEQPPVAAAAAAGPRAFQRLGCVKCHSFHGVGSPDIPLDDIVRRMDRATIRDWASGAGAARSKQSVTLARRKARAATDPDFESLIDYLASGAQGSTPP